MRRSNVGARKRQSRKRSVSVLTCWKIKLILRSIEMNRLDKIEETQLRKNIPEFQPGDTVRVHVRIKESETKERLQAFEGVVIARKHGGARETITVRKTTFGV